MWRRSWGWPGARTRPGAARSRAPTGASFTPRARAAAREVTLGIRAYDAGHLDPAERNQLALLAEET